MIMAQVIVSPAHVKEIEAAARRKLEIGEVLVLAEPSRGPEPDALADWCHRLGNC